jgi:hydrogenase expression/formation protein HypC
MCLAVPGRIAAIEGAEELRSAQVDFGGVSRAVNLAFVPEAREGDYVMVHVGFAIAVVDEELAREALAAMDELGEAVPLVAARPVVAGGGDG